MLGVKRRLPGRTDERPVYPREVHQRTIAREATRQSGYQTEVESWRELQSRNIEFTMKRLREPLK
jgi:hypothetical protein